MSSHLIWCGGSSPPFSAMVEIKILEIPGYKLNSDDSVVNGIIRLLGRNEGLCPCLGNDSEDKHCPCSNYRDNKGCTCGLYHKE